MDLKEHYYRNRDENIKEWQQFSSRLKNNEAYDRIDILANHKLSDLVIKPIKYKNTFFSRVFKK